MPIYQVAYQHGLLDDAKRALVARAITDAHVEATGAPRVFVHIFFDELPPGTCYSADGVDRHITGIQGAIRQGRSLEVRQLLLRRITAAWSEITGQPAKEVVAGLSEIESDTAMEYGVILPQPGGEAAWFKDNAAALDGISGTGL